MSDTRLWLDSKWPAVCTECEAEINPGDKVLFDYATRHVYCEACGEEMKPKPSVLRIQKRVGERAPQGEACPDCYHQMATHDKNGCKMCPCMRRGEQKQ